MSPSHSPTSEVSVSFSSPSRLSLSSITLEARSRNAEPRQVHAVVGQITTSDEARKAAALSPVGFHNLLRHLQRNVETLILRLRQEFIDNGQVLALVSHRSRVPGSLE